MARAIQRQVENNFIRGLITETSPLAFPTDAVTESDNTIFNKTGKVQRRKGLDYESSHSLFTDVKDNEVIKAFEWRS